MRHAGPCHVLGDDVSTDDIIAGRHCTSFDPDDLAPHVFSSLDPDLAGRIRTGDVIVAGANFGCGSAREHAPFALLGAGVAGVVAVSFARIFFRNAVNLALPVLACPRILDHAVDGAEVGIDTRHGVVVAGGTELPCEPMQPMAREIVDAGGLVPWVARELGLNPDTR